MSSSDSEEEQIFNFLTSGNIGALGYIFDVYDLQISNTDIRIDRGIDLYLILKNNQNLLVESCIESNGLEFWQDLINFTIPESCENRLQDIGWENQPINTGDGVTVNLDIFEITFDGLPINPENNMPYSTVEQFFEYFRENITSFIDEDITKFEFLNGNLNDLNKWKSDVPITSIFTINIPPGDDGSVICSEYDNCCDNSSHWIFSTVEAPQWGSDWANDGQHPVSGNRQFGFRVNLDGTFTFYTKGADRANRHEILKPLRFVFDEEKAIYDGGSSCWTSLINGIEEFITGGNSSVNVISKSYNNQNLKPKWSTIKEILESSVPVTSIPCYE